MKLKFLKSLGSQFKKYLWAPQAGSYIRPCNLFLFHFRAIQILKMFLGDFTFQHQMKTNMSQTTYIDKDKINWDYIRHWFSVLDIYDYPWVTWVTGYATQENDDDKNISQLWGWALSTPAVPFHSLWSQLVTTLSRRPQQSCGPPITNV